MTNPTPSDIRAATDHTIALLRALSYGQTGDLAGMEAAVRRVLLRATGEQLREVAGAGIRYVSVWASEEMLLRARGQN